MGGATRLFMLVSAPLPVPLLHHRFPSFLRLVRHYHHHHKLLPTSISSFSVSSSTGPTPHNNLLSTSSSSSSVPPLTSSHHLHSQASIFPDSFPHPDTQLWPEWSNLLENLSSAGYFDRLEFGGIDCEDEFVAVSNLPNEFVRAANACLAFARERANLLGVLSRRNIEAVVESGMPFLFRNGDESTRKMKSYLGAGQSNVIDTDKAQTVDLMRFILSYASNQIISSERNLYNRELVESSVRNLLSELSKLSSSNPDPMFFGSVNNFPERYGQTPRPLGQKVEMKRGDWICPRCSFMNFARNMKCLECEESRPKRQLVGGEWECPQCDFFNYGRNMKCLRCDCKRPGEISLGSTNTVSGMGYGSGDNANRADIESKLAANEEKAQRWFSKVSQLDSTSDMSNAIADDDFPEIMPLRKGVNRFVVSTRKTPLERRLANAQYGRNLAKDVPLEGNKNQLGVANNSNYVPFVPLPPDMFAKNPITDTEKQNSFPSNNSQWGDTASSKVQDSSNVSEDSMSQAEMNMDKEKEHDEKSERWFKKVAELHDVTDLASAISDEDFPEIMPMRKGENRFVVSKKKDRSLTSPAYKRRIAMEQAGNSTNFVPFVPFPPDYFAKKDKPEPDDPNNKASGETPPIYAKSDKPGEQSDDSRHGFQDRGNVYKVDNQQNRTGIWNLKSSENFNQKEKSAVYGGPTNSGNSTQNFINPQTNSREDGLTQPSDGPNLRGSSTPPSETQNVRERWSGKSLEGSAVKEPDPLDMSEEAKAERWFRRVAQIKDISELSQIPDEDFPSIMPMRKGVNRFVVSKRKTPLERRLTSPQYRRNLPIVSSDPVKKENDDS